MTKAQSEQRRKERRGREEVGEVIIRRRLSGAVPVTQQRPSPNSVGEGTGVMVVLRGASRCSSQ